MGSAVCVKNYPPEIMQPSSSTRATIVSAENQNGATIIKATFFFCHYYIVWESNNTGEARGQSWNESLKSRWIPGGSRGYTSGTKRKHFAALSSPRPCWRWLQLPPSCGSPQCYSAKCTVICGVIAGIINTVDNTFSLDNRDDIFVTHLTIIIIKTEVSTFPIVAIVSWGYVPKVVVSSHAVGFSRFHMYPRKAVFYIIY